MLDRRAMPVALLLIAGAAGCEPGDDPPADATSVAEPAPIPQPRIELAGCRDLDGATCRLAADEPSELRLWIDVHARAPLWIEIDGVPAAPARRAVEGGQTMTIVVAPTATRIAIDGVTPRWTAPFELEIEREAIPASVRSARQHFEAEDRYAARVELEAELDELDGVDRLAALQLLRKTLGPYHPDALARTEEAAALAQQLGRTNDLADAAAQATYINLNVSGDLVAAREWTLELERAATRSDEARVWADYYRGMLERSNGALTSSLRSFDEARRGAARLDMVEWSVATAVLLGPALAELGRGSEALALSRDALDHAWSPKLLCIDRAQALGNLAWTHVLLAEAGQEHDPPAPLLEDQLAMVDEHGTCPDPTTAAFARVNLALALLSEDEPEQAWTLLGDLLEQELPSFLEPWVAELTAQIGASTGREELLPPLLVVPDPGGELGLRFSAVVRHAATLERLGFRDAAIESYTAAEALLDETLAGVGINTDSELFLAGRLASARGLVDLLVGDGRVDEALCRARLARGRALRRLDRAARIAALSPAELGNREQLLFRYLGLRDRIEAERREDWGYSAAERAQREAHRRVQVDEAEALLDDALRVVGAERREPADCASLPRLGAGEVMIMQFPSATGSWIFIADRDGVSVTAASAPAASEDRASAALIESGDRLRAASRIRVLPTGAGWSIPFHALKFEDGVLLDVAPVVYSLDLARRRAPTDASATALVVADPADDLPYARREAEAVSRRLDEQGWTLTRLEGAAATRTALTEQLGAAALLHYAGHGVHAGPSGWQAALSLRDTDVLDVSDVLALPRVPEGVVLTGCNTATATIDTLDGGMNLARAFVLGGAGWVIAADVEVDDALAQALGEALYSSDASPTSFDGPTALREASLELRRQQPTSDWHVFRVFVP